MALCAVLCIGLGGLLAVLTRPASALSTTDFVTTWKTNNPGTSGSTSITIPTFGTGYNYDVDWNNDGVFDQLGITGSVTHNFGTAGTYTIRIQGTFPQIYFNNGGDRQKIINVNQWGTGVWRSMARAFYGASNLNSTATDTPTVYNVTDMSYTFAGAAAFNGNISNWFTTNVTNMSYMFYNATSFNGIIFSWNTKNVTNMSSMFQGATKFAQDLFGWDTGNVTDMSHMFQGATNFGQSDISGWNTANVTDMSYMFFGVVGGGFNQDLSWDTSKVTNMTYMFYNATFFNGDLSYWDTANVTDMSGMFFGTTFNRNISTWNTASVINMGAMFYGTPFNQNLSGWNTGKVTTMSAMFANTPAFNGNISTWDTTNVTDMSGMFQDAATFNQNISAWNTANVVSMDYMFANATAFNGDVTTWNTTNTLSMEGTFYGASAFDRSLSGWSVAKITDLDSILSDSNLSVANYDATLIGWSSQALQAGAYFSAFGLKYCDAAIQRQSMITDFNWTIEGDSLYCPVPTAPQNLAATSVDTGVSLSWTAPLSDNGYAVTSYTVSYKPSGGSTWTSVTGVTGTNYTVTGLTSGQDYDFRVVAVNTYGDSPASGTVTAQQQSISISSTGASIAVLPSGGTRFSSAKDTVLVTTNSITGYSLMISTSTTIRQLTNGAYIINPGTGTQSSPQLLTGASWGYRVSGIGSFGPTTIQETNVVSSTHTWAGVPALANPDVICTTVSPAINQATDVWYGLNSTTSQASGNYQATVLYTAITN